MSTVRLRAWGVPLATLALAATVAGLVVVHPLAPVGAAIGVAVLCWALSQPFHVALIFCVVLFARPAELFPVLEALSLAKMLALGATFLFVVSRLLARGPGPLASPFHAPMLALVIGVAISSVLSVSADASVTQLNDVFVKIVVLYVLLFHLVDRADRAALLHIALAITVGAMTCYSLYARVTEQIVVEGSRAAYVGALGDPNDFALVLFMYVPFLVEAVLLSRGARRVLLGMLLLLLVVGMAATQSRGGFMGLALALLVAFHDRGPLSWRLSALPVGAVVIIVLLVVSGATERQSGAVGSEGIDESAQGRLDAWDAGLRMLARHPAFGVGFGRFAESYERFCVNPAIWGHHETHNAYIKVAAETGLAGLVPFLVLVFLTFRTAARLRVVASRERDELARAAMRSALPATAGFCLMAFFLSQCWSWYFYILFAQVAAMGRLHGVDVRAPRIGGDEASVDGDLEARLREHVATASPRSAAQGAF